MILVNHSLINVKSAKGTFRMRSKHLGNTLPSPCTAFSQAFFRSILFGDVSEANGRVMPSDLRLDHVNRNELDARNNEA